MFDSGDVRARLSSSRRREKFIVWFLFFCGIVSVLTTIGIVGILLYESIGFFRQVSPIEFLTGTEWTPLFVKKSFGVLPLVCGTMLTSVIALCVAVPLGLLIAVYLAEYAPFWLKEILKPVLEILAGIPTIVFGYFALLFVTPLLQRFIPDLAGFNALSPGITLGIMILPLISSLCEDAISAVPRSLRHGSYAVGASKRQTVFAVVLPACRSGVVAAIILAFSRAIGETMLVTIAAGQMANFTLNPLVPIETMTAYIVQVSLGDTPTGSLAYQTIFAVGLLLFLITFVFNILAYFWKKKFSEVYQ